MFYEQSEIEDLLKCEHCTQPYYEYYPPRTLPCCEKTICYKCIQTIQNSVKDSKFKCISCGEEDSMPKKGFLVNKVISKLIEKQPKEVHRGDEAEKLKQNIVCLEDILNKMSFEMKNGEYLIKEECRELERQVQLIKEKRIEEIEQQTNRFFQKIENFEQKRIRKFHQMQEPLQRADDLINEVNSFIQHKKDYLKQLILNDKETMNSNEKLKEIREKLDKEREELKNEMLNKWQIID